MIKKIIFNVIKYPLIIIFIKTPLINILKRRFKYHRSSKKRNVIWFVLDTLFQREYFNKLKNKEEIRELTNTTLKDGEGKKWAEGYYNKHFQKLDELKKRRTGIISSNDASPIFEKMINFIKKNSLSEDENTYIIQLGSCSGRDLEFFYKIFPKLNYISTDINDEILDFQREKYNYPNFKFFMCYAEDIDKCISHFKISNKNLIIFSDGSLQYVNQYFIKDFFLKIKKYPALNLFLSEPVSLKFIDNLNKISDNRSNISFSHSYNFYAKEVDMKIIEFKIIRPYLKEDLMHGDTGHYFLHCSAKDIYV